MDKTANAYRTISEAAAELNLPHHVLRFWETRFPQIKPLKRGGGRRYYSPDDIELLRAIQTLLYNEGYTIKGVQRILKEQNTRQLIDASREAREHGKPLVIPPGPETLIEPAGEAASFAAVEDASPKGNSIETVRSSPQQNAPSCFPSGSTPWASRADIREMFEALLQELAECRQILDKSR